MLCRQIFSYIANLCNAKAVFSYPLIIFLLFTVWLKSDAGEPVSPSGENHDNINCTQPLKPEKEYLPLNMHAAAVSAARQETFKNSDPFAALEYRKNISIFFTAENQLQKNDFECFIIPIRADRNSITLRAGPSFC